MDQTELIRDINAVLQKHGWRYIIGESVEKSKGSEWHGEVAGIYISTLTPEGYAVESERERGSVQIYPVAALQHQSHALDI